MATAPPWPSLSEHSHLCPGGLPGRPDQLSAHLCPHLSHTAVLTSSASQTLSRPHRPWAEATAGLGRQGREGALGEGAGWLGLHPVELGQLEGRRTARGHRSRGTFRQCSPQPGAAAGSGFLCESSEACFRCPPPTHMTVTRWLTPPPLPQGWTGSNLPSPHTWARRAEDQRERRAV